MVAVAEASRNNAGRRGKIRCRPQMAFVRGNLVRRVGRQSSQFSATSSECRCRAPTSEGCPRWCPVHPDAWPDNREFLALEMEVVGLASTHLGSVSHVCVSNRRALKLSLLQREENCVDHVPPRVSIPTLKMLSPGAALCPRLIQIAIVIRESQCGQFCPIILANIRYGFVIALRTGEGQLCPLLRRPLAYQTVV